MGFKSSFNEFTSEVSCIDSIRIYLIYLLFSEIKALSSSIQAWFKHVGRLTNDTADSLAKQGIDRKTPLVAHVIKLCLLDYSLIPLIFFLLFSSKSELALMDSFFSLI